MTDRSQQRETTPITTREVLRLVWEADSYPHLGNEDERVSILLMREALAKAEHAMPGPDDPPEFAIWLTALRNGNLTFDQRDTIMEALYDLFDPSEEDDREDTILHTI